MKRPSIRAAVFDAMNRTFPIWERLGVHVSPVHYYWPTPDTRRLDDALWERPSELVGIDMRERSQLRLLEEISAAYKTDYDRFPRRPTGDPAQYYVENGSFVSTDAEMLYAMVRRLGPRKIIEVGSGFSTLLIDKALGDEMDGLDRATEYVVCDPFPRVGEGLPHVARIVKSPVQTVPLSLFESLGEGDILFIDSSHVLRIGSDVHYLYLEVLPRLAEGVFVHIHDIFMPAEYPRDWVLKHHRFWTEQYLLQAFLAFNTSWEVVWAGAYMARKHRPLLSQAFGSHEATTAPGSFWMRRARGLGEKGNHA